MNISEYITNQKIWSQIAFGKGKRTEGVLHHIEKEIEEVRMEPYSLEWIDIVILALDGAWRAGYTPEEIEKALIAKQEKNAKRKWPYPPPSDDVPSFHIKGIED
jgi:hypothetical protein